MAEGLVLLFEPKRGTTSAAGARLKSQSASLPVTQVIIGERVVAVVLAKSAAGEFEKSKTDILARAHALELEFTVEDIGSIDEACTVRLSHASPASYGGVITPVR